MRVNIHFVSALMAAALLTGSATTARAAATLGFTETFSVAGTAGWGGGSAASNPGTGGVGGAGDGYLLLTNAGIGNFGAYNTGSNYTGNWTAAGITQVSFYLRDVGADQSFSLHFLLTSGPGTLGTSWQYNTPMDGPTDAWQLFTVDLTSDANWTRTRGTDSLSQVLQSVSFAHFRHDLPPFETSPNAIAGELGIDSITLGAIPEPSAAALLAVPLLMRRRRRSTNR